MIGIHEIEVGTGPSVKDGDKISLHYKGTFPEGKEFDSSYKRNETFTFKVGVGQVIKGFDLGVIGMQVGGKRRIEIPSEFAYGKSGAGGAIPPNQDLVFELELVAIK